jgi:hypothetical protein
MIFLVLKWISIMVINLLGFLTAPIIFPIAYLLKDIRIVRKKLLWIYYDDEDNFGWDVHWWSQSNNYKRNFWTAYKWCAIRNPAWNLHTLFKINYNPTFIVTKEKGLIQKNHKIIKPNFFNTCVLKYVNENGDYMDNKGEYLSLAYSVIGKSFIIFYLNNKKYFRFSYANMFFNDIWLEIQLGWSTRATFRLKIKKIEKIY